jgi:hypothetical protein
VLQALGCRKNDHSDKDTPRNTTTNKVQSIFDFLIDYAMNESCESEVSRRRTTAISRNQYGQSDNIDNVADGEVSKGGRKTALSQNQYIQSDNMKNITNSEMSGGITTAISRDHYTQSDSIDNAADGEVSRGERRTSISHDQNTQCTNKNNATDEEVSKGEKTTAISHDQNAQSDSIDNVTDRDCPGGDLGIRITDVRTLKGMSFCTYFNTVQSQLTVQSRK